MVIQHQRHDVMLKINRPVKIWVEILASCSEIKEIDCLLKENFPFSKHKKEVKQKQSKTKQKHKTLKKPQCHKTEGTMQNSKHPSTCG